jgi:hypothetical protein
MKYNIKKLIKSLIYEFDWNYSCISTENKIIFSVFNDTFIITMFDMEIVGDMWFIRNFQTNEIILCKSTEYNKPLEIQELQLTKIFKYMFKLY